MSRPFSNRMFPDVVTFTPQSYAVGARGGPTPVPGTPITIPAYVEEIINTTVVDNATGVSSSGAITSQTPFRIIFRDPGTGGAPVPGGTDAVFIWTAHEGKTLLSPRTLLANGENTTQGSLWSLGAREVK